MIPGHVMMNPNKQKENSSIPAHQLPALFAFFLDLFLYQRYF